MDEFGGDGPYRESIRIYRVSTHRVPNLLFATAHDWGGKVEAARGERIEEEQGRQKDDNSSLTRIHRNNDEEEGNQLTMEI